MLAAVDLQSPMTWAIVIGWIMSVVLHEFAHGLVGYLGGDYTIKERGGLTLNPIQYIDPIFSILLPVLFLVMGGIPLPGGVTFIRRDLLRSRLWDSATSAAGPFMNFLLFLACALPFHPAVGWFNVRLAPEQYSSWQIFLGAMAQLQMTAMLLNLFPVPPLDGFNIISPYLKEETRIKLTTPPISTTLFIIFFLAVSSTPGPMRLIMQTTMRIESLLGFDDASMFSMWRGFQIALFGPQA